MYLTNLLLFFNVKNITFTNNKIEIIDIGVFQCSPYSFSGWEKKRVCHRIICNCS